MFALIYLISIYIILVSSFLYNLYEFIDMIIIIPFNCKKTISKLENELMVIKKDNIIQLENIKERDNFIEKLNIQIINDIEIKKSSYKKILELENIIINKDIVNKEIILNLKKEIDNNKKIDNLCSVCLENKINICCIPCGHTYCDKCIRSTYAYNCFICRKNITNTIKIYI